MPQKWTSAISMRRSAKLVAANTEAQSEIKDGGPTTFRPANRDDFQRAALAAQQSHAQDWHTMSSREQARAIYAELQKLDAERAKVTVSGRRGRSFIDTNK